MFDHALKKLLSLVLVASLGFPNVAYGLRVQSDIPGVKKVLSGRGGQEEAVSIEVEVEVPLEKLQAALREDTELRQYLVPGSDEWYSSRNLEFKKLTMDVCRQLALSVQSHPRYARLKPYAEITSNLRVRLLGQTDVNHRFSLYDYVENAIDAIPDRVGFQNGEGIRKIQLRLRQEGAGLVIEFSDNGVGITAVDLRDEVFHKEFSRKRGGGRGGGKGKALSENRGWVVVKHWNGKVEVDSRKEGAQAHRLTFVPTEIEYPVTGGFRYGGQRTFEEIEQERIGTTFRWVLPRVFEATPEVGTEETATDIVLTADEFKELYLDEADRVQPMDEKVLVVDPHLFHVYANPSLRGVLEQKIRQSRLTQVVLNLRADLDADQIRVSQLELPGIAFVDHGVVLSSEYKNAPLRTVHVSTADLEALDPLAWLFLAADPNLELEELKGRQWRIELFEDGRTAIFL